MSNFSYCMKGPPVLALVQTDDISKAVEIVQALKSGGIGMVEVVLRTDAALAAISEIRSRVDNVVVGAGTVISGKLAQAAKGAGAQFLVSPGLTPALAEAMKETELPFVPGVSTPSEIVLALEYEVTELKFFPASLLGGADMLKTLGGVFRQASFCPTGGVNEKNCATYLALRNVFAVGGSWITSRELVEAANWDGIRKRAEAVRTIAERLGAP